MTHRAAVIGSPIAHSLSPVLHRAAYDQLGLDDWSYEAIEVAPEELGEFLASRDTSWAGLSVTAPHKKALLSYGLATQQVYEVDAANTLLFGHPNRVYNTDVTGMELALAHRGVTQAETATIVGAGATARSAMAALTRLGVREFQVIARSTQRARDSLDPVAERLEASWTPLDWDQLEAIEPDSTDLLVSTVPIVYEPQQAERLAKAAPAIFEIVYHHYPTRLSEAAHQAERISIDGVDLLVFQALEQVHLMTGLEPEPEPLLEICRHEIANR